MGKFYSSYFGDEPKRSTKETEEEIRNKIEQDWNRKIVLPEAKESFKIRYERAREIIGEYPEKFI